MAVEIFDEAEDHKNYLAWRGLHNDDGFVLNASRNVENGKTTLHIASCRHITDWEGHSYTAGQNIKICGLSKQALLYLANKLSCQITKCKDCM